MSSCNRVGRTETNYLLGRLRSISFSSTIIVLMIIFFLGVTIWILSITSRMSKIIHDDHSSLWVPAEKHNIDDWYSEMGVCLNATHISHEKLGKKKHLDYNIFQDCKPKNEQHVQVNGRDYRRSRIPPFCRFSRCNLPFSGRNYHLKELSTRITNNTPRMSLLRLMVRMAVADHAIVFIGDSVTKQVRIFIL